jgi:hypothetical protein
MLNVSTDSIHNFEYTIEVCDKVIWLSYCIVLEHGLHSEQRT